MRMSSKYTTTKVIVKGCGISSIILIKVVGEFVKPKGMTNHSKIPSFDLKVVFHTYVYSTRTWW
jgi:hypothetical protein